MSGHGKGLEYGCGCGGIGRREFLAAAGATAGLIAVRSLSANAAEKSTLVGRSKERAAVRVVFLYPMTRTGGGAGRETSSTPRAGRSGTRLNCGRLRRSWG